MDYFTNYLYATRTAARNFTENQEITDIAQDVADKFFKEFRARLNDYYIPPENRRKSPLISRFSYFEIDIDSEGLMLHVYVHNGDYSDIYDTIRNLDFLYNDELYQQKLEYWLQEHTRAVGGFLKSDHTAEQRHLMVDNERQKITNEIERLQRQLKELK